MNSCWYDDGCRRDPRKMPVAMFSARVSALLPRGLALDGDDDRGILTFGGGGNVVMALMGFGDSAIGDSARSSLSGSGRRSRSGRRLEVISAKTYENRSSAQAPRKRTIDSSIDLYCLLVADQDIFLS